MKIFIFQLLIFYAVHTTAQPGGGGGLKIMNVFDYDGKSIEKNDTNLQIQHYILSDKKHKIDDAYMLTEADKSRYHYFESQQTHIYLPAHIYKKNKRKSVLNQRLVLYFNNDTMTLDFIDIMEENGAGNSFKMEHIYFQSGYFKCYLNPQKSHQSLWNNANFTEKDKETLYKHLATGIDGNTLTYLKGVGILEHIPDPNLENKRLQRERAKCEERVSGKYIRLCFNMIEIQDEDSTINLSSSLRSNTLGQEDTAHFLYFFQFNHRFIQNISERQLASAVLKKLNAYKIKINDQAFSGQIKLAVMYYNVGISTAYSKYVVYVNQYLDGKLVRSLIWDDINLETEERMVRPN